VARYEHLPIYKLPNALGLVLQRVVAKFNRYNKDSTCYYLRESTPLRFGIGRSRQCDGGRPVDQATASILHLPSIVMHHKRMKGEPCCANLH
jgi:hypothetical protein